MKGYKGEVTVCVWNIGRMGGNNGENLEVWGDTGERCLSDRT